MSGSAKGHRKNEVVEGSGEKAGNKGGTNTNSMMREMKILMIRGKKGAGGTKRNETKMKGENHRERVKLDEKK